MNFQIEEKLSSAIKTENVSQVAVLLQRYQQRPDRNSTHLRMEFALADAGAVGNLEIIRLLIKAGVWPLHVGAHKAASYGHVEAMRLFLDTGVGIEEEIKYGGTLLASAAGTGQVEVAKFLLERGADINGGRGFLTDDEDEMEHFTWDEWLKNGWFGTPLENAARGGHLKLVDFLLERGAKTLGFSADEYRNRAREQEGSAFFDTVATGQDHRVDSHLRGGTDPNRCNANGETALHVLLERPSDIGLVFPLGGKQLEVLERLAPLSDLTLRNRESKTALDLAIARRDAKAVAVLLRGSWDVKPWTRYVLTLRMVPAGVLLFAETSLAIAALLLGVFVVLPLILLADYARRRGFLKKKRKSTLRSSGTVLCGFLQWLDSQISKLPPR